MSILIKGMNMPDEPMILILFPDGNISTEYFDIGANAKAIELPPHGRLIDADALRQSMYHEVFETDSPMQKWDSGCWIRYKMFERLVGNAPPVIEADV